MKAGQPPLEPTCWNREFVSTFKASSVVSCFWFDLLVLRGAISSGQSSLVLRQRQVGQVIVMLSVRKCAQTCVIEGLCSRFVTPTNTTTSAGLLEVSHWTNGASMWLALRGEPPVTPATVKVATCLVDPFRKLIKGSWAETSLLQEASISVVH